MHIIILIRDRYTAATANQFSVRESRETERPLRPELVSTNFRTYYVVIDIYSIFL